MLVITLPFRAPTPSAPLGPADQKVLEGMNDQGLTFSLLAYASAKGPRDTVAKTREVLSALDLGSWALGQFSTVAEIKAALQQQPVILAPLARLGGGQPPVHFVAHDRSGASIVIEYDNGKQNVYDNGVGVTTNGPSFPWHLTNLGNYSFLNNVDKSETTFGTFVARQPDAGIATQGLPSSDTSVGRFIRAAYYAKFARKESTPDQAVLTLAHVMNNFDRPKDITIDVRHRCRGRRFVGERVRCVHRVHLGHRARRPGPYASLRPRLRRAELHRLRPRPPRCGRPGAHGGAGGRGEMGPGRYRRPAAGRALSG